jgi:hypothetical protein
MSEKQTNDLVDSVFYAARDMGYVLAGKQAPGTFHKYGDLNTDRPDAEEELRDRLEKLYAGLGLRGSTTEDLVESLNMQGGPAWRREALAKVIKARALVYQRNEQADREAVNLLGQAVQEWESKHV